MPESLKQYDPNKSWIEWKLDPNYIIDQLGNLIPWRHTIGLMDSETPWSEVGKSAVRETPILGSILAGEPTDALKEAILMGMPIKAKKGYVTMPNGKKIKLDKEVIIDEAKTDKYKDIIDKADRRDWAGAEYEGPGYSTYYSYEGVPLKSQEGKDPLSPRDFEALSNSNYQQMPTARELNRDFRYALDDMVSNGDVDRYTANDWYKEYKVDPKNYTPKDAKAFNDMLDDISKGNVYYENLYRKQKDFDTKVTRSWENDKRTKRWKDYNKLKEKYPDINWNGDVIGTGGFSIKQGYQMTKPRVNQALKDIDDFRKKYGAPDESNLKSSYDFAHKVIESKLREPMYEGQGSAWLGDNLDLSPRLDISKPSNRWSYDNPYYKLLEESGEYAVTPKDFNKIVENSRLDNTMAAHRQAIQAYADDVKTGLMELNDLTPSQKLEFNKRISNILEPIINDNRLSINEKKDWITREMNQLSKVIKVQRLFN